MLNGPWFQEYLETRAWATPLHHHIQLASSTVPDSSQKSKDYPDVYWCRFHHNNESASQVARRPEMYNERSPVIPVYCIL